MRRKIIAILLCLTIAVGMLAGCGGNQAGQDGSSASDDAAKESNVPVDTSTEVTGKTEFANDKLLNLDLSVIEGYEESAKNATGIDVTIVTSPDVAAYQTSIQQSIREESAPGLFTWWGGYQLQTLVENGLVDFIGTDLHNHRHADHIERYLASKDYRRLASSGLRVLNDTL